MGSHAGLCPYGVGFAVSIVLIIYVGFILKKRPLTRRMFLLLLVAFITLAVVDVPTALGRCPGEDTIRPRRPRPQEGSDTSEGFASPGAPILYGLTVGLLSFTSPCGLPLVPAYILYYLGKEITVWRGFYGGFSATFGLLTAFSLMGVVISAAGITLAAYADVFEILSVIVTLAMGVFMLLGLRIPFFRAPRVVGGSKGVLGLFLFGCMWGIAVISCSPYLFIPFVLFSLTLGNAGIEAHAGYALGLGLPIMIIALLISLGRGGMVKEFVKLSPRLNKLSGIFLIIIGSSLLLYTYILKTFTNIPFEAFSAFLLLIIVLIILDFIANLRVEMALKASARG